ncbi:MAG: hypothetical protein IKI78_05065, partial [Clostridia bacterium]|nr:hypothetical protein [Clostridia bacterium]
HWYVDGRDVTPGGSLTYTVSNATESYSICAKLVADGKVIAESSSEQVNIKTGFFARFIAFFRQLFGRLPFINQ